MTSALLTELPSRFSGGIVKSVGGDVRRVAMMLVSHPNCYGLFFFHGFGPGHVSHSRACLGSRLDLQVCRLDRVL